MHEWLIGCGNKLCTSGCGGTEVKLLKGLHDFPKRFTSYDNMSNSHVSYDDEDLDAWESEAKRWTRLFFLSINGEDDLAPILKVFLFQSLIF